MHLVGLLIFGIPVGLCLTGLLCGAYCLRNALVDLRARRKWAAAVGFLSLFFALAVVGMAANAFLHPPDF